MSENVGPKPGRVSLGGKLGSENRWLTKEVFSDVVCNSDLL